MYIWGEGRAAGQTFCRQSRVGSGRVGSGRAERVGSGQRFAGSGRSKKSDP